MARQSSSGKRKSEQAARGDLAEIDVGAEVMRQLVQTLIAAVHPLHHLGTKLGENSCLFCDASRFRGISARRITWHSMIPLVATDTTDGISTVPARFADTGDNRRARRSDPNSTVSGATSSRQTNNLFEALISTKTLSTGARGIARCRQWPYSVAGPGRGRSLKGPRCSGRHFPRCFLARWPWAPAQSRRRKVRLSLRCLPRAKTSLVPTGGQHLPRLRAAAYRLWLGAAARRWERRRSSDRRGRQRLGIGHGPAATL